MTHVSAMSRGMVEIDEILKGTYCHHIQDKLP